jgi:hypothetical protein
MQVSPKLPHASSPTFADEIRALDDSLADSLTYFMTILEDENRGHDDRFSALYGALHRLRREGKSTQYIELCHRYESEFGEQPYFDTFRVIVHSSSADTRRGYRQALDAAHRAVEHLPITPGVLHQQAEIAANVFELEQSADPDELSQALRNVNSAIRLSRGNNPQHYATRARLHLAGNDTESARSDVSAAIANEDPASRDFARRVSRYESIRAVLLIQERQQSFLKRERQLRDEIEGFRAQQLQLLGLLAAVIAFISSAATIAAKADLAAGFRLFIIAGGVIAMVFASIAVSFGQRPIARLLPGLIVGLALILVGYYVPAPGGFKESVHHVR